MNKSKVSVVTNQIWQKVETIVGWALAALSVLFQIVNLTDTKNESFTLMLWFFFITLAIGVFMIIKGRKRKKLINDFKNYVQILAGDPFNSLDTIAERSNASVDAVKKNLQLMIKKKFFANAVIDEGSNSLILNGRADTQQVLSAKAAESLPKVAPATAQTFAQAQPEVEMLTIKCKGCGGVNIVPRGKVVECEYCGNMIKGE